MKNYLISSDSFTDEETDNSLSVEEVEEAEEAKATNETLPENVTER